MKTDFMFVWDGIYKKKKNLPQVLTHQSSGSNSLEKFSMARF